MHAKSSAALSLPMSETVRGYEIKRLAIGQYLLALEALRTSGQALHAALFPGMDALQVFAQMKRMDVSQLSSLFLRAMEVVPGEAVCLLSALTGVDRQALMKDPAVGLDGAAEMLEAFWRLNGIENFTAAARRMAAQIQSLRSASGFSG